MNFIINFIIVVLIIAVSLISICFSIGSMVKNRRRIKNRSKRKCKWLPLKDMWNGKILW